MPPEQLFASESPAAPAFANPYAPPRADLDFVRLLPHAHEAPLASRGARLGAALLDAMLMVIAMLPGIILLFGMEAAFGTALIVVLALALGIYQWYLIATRG